MPNFIWRTGKGKEDIPHRFSEVKPGDRWIGFAYTTSDKRERPLSLVTGFYECVQPALFRDIPPAGVPISDGGKQAWLIEGKSYGKQPKKPVGVPPLADILRKTIWQNQAVIPITGKDFNCIRDSALKNQFDTRRIPLLGREPENEQELLAAVIYGHKKLGIEKIIRVRKAFPDLLVQFGGNSEEVHLELEVYSGGFFSHGHSKQVSKCRFIGDNKRIAVLCWIDNRKDVKKHVYQVYELRSLIRDNKKLVWKPYQVT